LYSYLKSPKKGFVDYLLNSLVYSLVFVLFYISRLIFQNCILLKVNIPDIILIIFFLFWFVFMKNSRNLLKFTFIYLFTLQCSNVRFVGALVRSLLDRSCPCSFTRSFVPLFVRSFVHSCPCFFTRSFVLFTRSLVRSFVPLFVRSFVRSCPYFFARSFVFALVCSLFGSFVPLLVHSLVHALVCSIVRLYVRTHSFVRRFIYVLNYFVTFPNIYEGYMSISFTNFKVSWLTILALMDNYFRQVELVYYTTELFFRFFSFW